MTHREEVVLRIPSNHILHKVWFDEVYIPNNYIDGMESLVEYGTNINIDWFVKDSQKKGEA